MTTIKTNHEILIDRITTHGSMPIGIVRLWNSQDDIDAAVEPGSIRVCRTASGSEMVEATGVAYLERYATMVLV